MEQNTRKLDDFDELEKLLFQEHETTQKIRQSALSQTERAIRLELLDFIKNAASSNDLQNMITVERKFVTNDLERNVNSKEMKDSLLAALSNLNAIEKLIDIVKDPERYHTIDESFQLAKNRQGGLPYDDARQSFSSHLSRLINGKKYHLSDEEKQIIDARFSMFRQARDLYIEAQKHALGIASTQKRSRKL